MQIQPIQTRVITADDRDLYTILDDHLDEFHEGEILAIASKIVALCQGRSVPVEQARQADLIEAEATWWLPATRSRYHVYLTIKANALMPGAGVDASNADGCFVLWPHAPQQAANAIRAYLRRRFGLRRVGVLITDSRPLPMRWGVTGFAVAHSGFLALRDYRGQEDLFGRPLRMTQANIADALAAASVLLMGEGNERTPLARITDVDFLEFQDRDPSREELDRLTTHLDDDLYGPLLTGVSWQRGRG